MEGGGREREREREREICTAPGSFFYNCIRLVHLMGRGRERERERCALHLEVSPIRLVHLMGMEYCAVLFV